MSLQNYNYTIAPGATIPIGQAGSTFIRCLSASGPLDLQIDRGARFSGFAAGLSFESEPGSTFDIVEVTNMTAAPVAFEMAVAKGRLNDDRLTLQSGNVSITPPDSLAGTTGTAPGLIPARAGRSEIVIKNTGSSPIEAGPVGAEVLAIEGGQSLTLATSGEVSLTGAATFVALEVFSNG